MNELKEALEQFHHSDNDTLRQAAIKWSAYVLQHNDGAAVKLGLAISQALAEYINYLERPQ